MKKIIYTLSFIFFTSLHAQDYNIEDYDFYTEACKRGQHVSCSHLAIIYEEGKLVKQDMKKAEKLYAKACGGGDAFACHNMGVIYSKSKNPALKKISLSMYEKACRGGYPKSCDYLGRYYRDSHIDNIDHAKALEMYQLGCELNSRYSCKELRILEGSSHDGYTH